LLRETFAPSIPRLLTVAGAPCSAQSAAAGVPLIGSAGTCSAILAVELASPWAPKLAGSAASDAHLDEAIRRIGKRAKGLRLLFFDGDGRSEDGRHKVFLFERGGGPFRGFARRELSVARPALADVLDQIHIGETGELVLEAALSHQASQHPQQQGRDLFVCTHGSRDACCGKLGFPLYRHLCDRLAEPGVRLWRSSHLGGHRFAPTLLDLPSGRLYGRMRADDADWLRDGDAGPARITEHYRGMCAMPPAAQVLEQQMWMRHGMRWLDAALEWRCDGKDDDARVSLRAAWTDGMVCECSGELRQIREAGRTLPESCGKEPVAIESWSLSAWSQSGEGV